MDMGKHTKRAIIWAKIIQKISKFKAKFTLSQKKIWPGKVLGESKIEIPNRPKNE